MTTESDDSNIIDFKNGKPIAQPKFEKIYGFLESDDDKFHSLVKHYQQACNQKKVKDPLVKRAIAIEIQSYKINRPIELIIKMSILERELGFKIGKRTREIVYDDLMFTLFKKSLVNFIETTLYDNETKSN